MYEWQLGGWREDFRKLFKDGKSPTLFQTEKFISKLIEKEKYEAVSEHMKRLSEIYNKKDENI